MNGARIVPDHSATRAIPESVPSASANLCGVQPRFRPHGNITTPIPNLGLAAVCGLDFERYHLTLSVVLSDHRSPLSSGHVTHNPSSLALTPNRRPVAQTDVGCHQETRCPAIVQSRPEMAHRFRSTVGRTCIFTVPQYKKLTSLRKVLPGTLSIPPGLQPLLPSHGGRRRAFMVALCIFHTSIRGRTTSQSP